jgi:tetratricopeptide (TPR) repeat protein
LTNKKDYAGAESALRSAIANFTKLAAEFPKAPKYRSSLANAHFNLGVLLGEREQFAEAERAYRRALDLQERLTREFPVNSTYAVELAKSCGEIGTLAADQGRPQEAVEIFNKAIDALETLIQRNPQQASARTALGVTYSRRAPALSQLGRHDDAMHDWDRALALCSKSNRMEVRSYRAAELVRAGRTAEAVKEGEELAATSEASRVILYRCARVFALASSDAANPAREHHAVRAVELLRAATTKGFHDFANLLRDENLAALRGRDDFAAYLWEYADTAAK